MHDDADDIVHDSPEEIDAAGKVALRTETSMVPEVVTGEPRAFVTPKATVSRPVGSETETAEAEAAPMATATGG